MIINGSKTNKSVFNVRHGGVKFLVCAHFFTLKNSFFSDVIVNLSTLVMTGSGPNATWLFKNSLKKFTHLKIFIFD